MLAKNIEKARGTMCASCRTVQNNRKRTYATGERNPNWKGYGPVTGAFMCIVRNNARVRGIDFHIIAEDVAKVWTGKCAYTGRELGEGEASVDRIDPARGYEPDNIQIVHKSVNIMKRELTHDEFVSVCKEVAKYL
jgi:hypothetical protein